MLVRIVEGPTQPSEAEEVRELWQGGHIGSEERALSAAALVGVFPELEVGTWYPFDVYLQYISAPIAPNEHPIWTTVDVSQSGVNGAWKASIEVEQEFAIRTLCSGIASHGSSLSKGRKIWIRFE